MSGLEDKKKGRKPRVRKPKLPKTREEELLEENLYLRAKNEYLKKIESLGCRAGKTRRREQIAVFSELRQKYPLEKLLIIAKIPRSCYYYHLRRRSEAPKHSHERIEVQKICTENKGRYGYRRVTLELHQRGFQVNHKLAMKLMKQEHLTCQLRKKSYYSYRGELGKIVPNLLNRNFGAEKLNLKWATDVTEFKLFGQKLYPSPIMDL